jgi:hypothetical protein
VYEILKNERKGAESKRIGDQNALQTEQLKLFKQISELH